MNTMRGRSSIVHFEILGEYIVHYYPLLSIMIHDYPSWSMIIHHDLLSKCYRDAHPRHREISRGLQIFAHLQAHSSSVGMQDGIQLGILRKLKQDSKMQVLWWDRRIQHGDLINLNHQNKWSESLNGWLSLLFRNQKHPKGTVQDDHWSRLFRCGENDQTISG